VSEVLSQKEIDQLLSELSSGEKSPEELGKEEEKDKVKTYNFRHPKKLARDQLRTLEMIYENYARYVSTALSAQLRTFVDMKVASVEALSYEEFTRSLPAPTVIGIGELRPLKGQCLLEINPNVAFSIVDRLFGGWGTSKQLESRVFTDIEGMALRQVMNWMFRELPEAWQNVVSGMEPELKELESNPLFTQIVHHNDMIILVTFEVVVNEVEGLVNFCMPHLMLEPVVGRLTAQHWFSSMQEKKIQFQDGIKKRLSTSFLEISAEFPPSIISVQDLLNLQEGDVLLLEASVEDNLRVKVGSKAKFSGKPGKIKDRLAIRVTGEAENIKEEEDDE